MKAPAGALVSLGWRWALLVLGVAAAGALALHLPGHPVQHYLNQPARAAMSALADRPGLRLAAHVTTAGTDRAMVGAALAGAAVMVLRRQRFSLVALPFVAYLGAAAAALAIKVLVYEPGPGGGTTGHLRHDISYLGFPSGHVTQATATYGLLVVLFLKATSRRWQQVAAITFGSALIAAVAGSRLYLGVHWLTDVAGGLLVGGLWLAAINRVVWGRPRRGAGAARTPATGPVAAGGEHRSPVGALSVRDL